MTRLVRFANNATSKLAANLSAIGLTISLTPGDGAKFPTLTTGQFFKGTLVKLDGTKEVVKVTARSTDTLTIVRANESVAGVQTSYAFSAGDKFELRLTAEALSDELDRLDAAAFLDVVNKATNYTIVEADVSKLIKTDTTAGNITHTLPQISTLTGSFEVQVSKDTGDANIVTVNRAGADTINGLTSYALAAQYQCVWLVADLATNTWTAITSASASNAVTDSFIGSGTAGPFTLTGDPGSKNNTMVHVGGVYQNKATYTVTGNQLTVGGTVASGVIVECGWSQPLSIGTPSDGTVTTVKLADNAVSTAKILAGAVTFAKTTGLPPRATRIDVASVAGVVDLTTNAPDTDDIQFTGNNAMTGFTAAVGRVVRFVVATGATPSFVNGANLVTHRGVNVQLAAGDSGELRVLAGSVVELIGFVVAAGVTPADGSITAPKLSGAQTGSAPVYGCRAWCKFNGATAGTNAPTAGGNVTNVTRNGAGDYTINFTTAMPDANYAVQISGKFASGGFPDDNYRQMSPEIRPGTAPTTSAVRVVFYSGRSSGLTDVDIGCVSIIR